MPLATIFVVYFLLASPAAGGAAHPPTRILLQSTSPQEPDAAKPSEPTTQPAPEPKPDQAPAESQAPAAAQPETPSPASTPPPSESKPDESKPPESTTATPAGTKSTMHRRKKKKATPPGETPSKTVVRNGSTTEPEAQISPRLSQAQATNSRQNTSQLLGITDGNLQKLSSRQLTSAQQDVVKQIHTYKDQAKAAMEADDLPRAHNLAVKARLLSDDLLKH